MVSHLTVIDPRHGLAGQRLELVSSRSARGPAFVVVRLSDGRRRSIRRSVTDLAAASPEEQGASKALAHINVRTLLTLLHHLNSTLASPIEEVIRDEHPVEICIVSRPRPPPPKFRTRVSSLCRVFGSTCPWRGRSRSRRASRGFSCGCDRRARR
ncbi:DUF5372 family protein [Mesorhizobium sp. AaZ16]|uniref:DUF5372 family protein n=1 Tax=Mesorhizobium sp. AaZ16 TaxID=3402289 RepID=UPI00374E27E9